VKKEEAKKFAMLIVLLFKIKLNSLQCLNQILIQCQIYKIPMRFKNILIMKMHHHSIDRYLHLKIQNLLDEMPQKSHQPTFNSNLTMNTCFTHSASDTVSSSGPFQANSIYLPICFISYTSWCG